MSLFQRKGAAGLAATAGPSEADLKRQVARAMADKKKMSGVIAQCTLCQMYAAASGDSGSGGGQRSASRSTTGDYVISKGEYVMLCLKPLHNTVTQSGGTREANQHLALSPYHLQIVPTQHVSSVLHLDDDAVKEIDRYKQCVSHMFQRESFTDVVASSSSSSSSHREVSLPSVLFTESAVHFERHSHAVIDCIPAQRGVEVEAKMFFKEVRLLTLSDIALQIELTHFLYM